MMRLKTITLLAIISMAAFSGAASAKFGGGPPGALGPGLASGGPGLMLEHMADHLDLTDEQRQSVKNILEAARPEIEALRERFHENREALRALEPDDAAYPATLDNLALSNGQLATEATLLFTRLRNDIHAVLTEEQVAKLERGRARMEKRFEGRRRGG